MEFSADGGSHRAQLKRASASLIPLGISAGSTFASYLASCGYFQDMYNAPWLLGVQSMIVYTVQFLVIALQQLFDDQVDQYVGVMHTYGCRIISSAMVNSLLLLVVPFCASVRSVLLMAALVAFAGTAQLSSATQLAAVNVEGAGTVISLGFCLGCMVPLVTTRLTGFEPGCDRTNAILFFDIACAVGLLGTVPWVVGHRMALEAELREDMPRCAGDSESTALNQKRSEEAGDATAFIPQAYQALRTTSAPGLGGEEQSIPIFTQQALGIFTNFVVGFMLVPLFPNAGPLAAQSLVLIKCIGDLISRVMAATHAVLCAERGHILAVERYVAYAFIAVRTVLAAYLINELRAKRINGVTAESVISVIAIFALGGYGFLMLDLDAQMQRPDDKTWRKRVQRLHFGIMFSGQIVGSAAGLAML